MSFATRLIISLSSFFLGIGLPIILTWVQLKRKCGRNYESLPVLGVVDDIARLKKCKEFRKR